MSSKFCSLIFLIGSIQIIFGQQDLLKCDYRGGYTCSLMIFNTGNAFFTTIDGEHQEGKGDSDVSEVTASILSNSATIPPVICANFVNVVKVTYTSIGLENIDKNAFKSCKFIKQIILSDNEIATIDELAFRKNVELQRLYLAQNRISTLPTTVFETLVSLKQLDLSSNQIETLANEWFQNLENLQHLNLNSNQISELSSGVFTSLINIAYINLGKNKLETLNSDSFGELPKLTTVDAKSNQINAIDENFIDKTAISNLNLDENVCASDDIIDSSPQREAMKNDLATCFENFNNFIGTTKESTTTEESTSDSTTEESTSDSTTEESTSDSTTEENTSDSTTEDNTTEETTEETEEITPDSASGITIGKIILIVGLSIRILLN